MMDSRAGSSFEASADSSSSAKSDLLGRTPNFLTLATWLTRFPGPVDSYF